MSFGRTCSRPRTALDTKEDASVHSGERRLRISTVSSGHICSRHVSDTDATDFLIRASIEGRRLKVVLWDISQSPPKLITPMSTHPMSEMQAKWPSGVAGTESALHSVVPTQIAQQQTVRYPSQAALVQAMGGFSIEQRQRQQAVCYAQQQQQQQKHQMQAQFQAQAQAQTEAARQAQQATYYATQGQLKRHDSPQAQGSSSRTAAEYISSQTGTPINVRGGVAVTVSRGVFVSGMNYKAREEDIKRKFSSVGNIVKCTLHTDASTGKSKGVATLLFESASEAQKAINKYHHATWMDKEIKVRPDKETTTIVAPPRLDSSPLIVNGSRLQ